MGNHPCKKFPQENYNGEDTLHSNHRRSQSSMTLEEEKEEEEEEFIRNILFIKINSEIEYVLTYLY